MVNHFRYNDNYTTKSGLSRNLKNLIQKEIDIDTFFPKTYDLFDHADFEDFLEEFKFTFAVSLLFELREQDPFSLSINDRIRLKTIIEVLKRKFQSIEKTINMALMKNQLILVTK